MSNVLSTTEINPLFRNADGSMNFDKLFAMAQNKEVVEEPAAVPSKTAADYLRESNNKVGIKPDELMPRAQAVPEAITVAVNEVQQAAAEVPVTPASTDVFQLTEMTDEEKGLQATVSLAMSTLENLSTLRFIENNEDLISWVCTIVNSNEQVKAHADKLGIECTISEEGCKIAFDEVAE